jgi:hypothetical protein
VDFQSTGPGPHGRFHIEIHATCDGRGCSA